MKKLFEKCKQYFFEHKIDITIFLISVIFSFLAFYFNTIKFQNDDQFTIYRYIENIAGGVGFVFNAGEHVLGSTTPLFTLLGALAKYIFAGVETRTLVACINIILISLSAVCFFRFSRLFISRNFSYIGVSIFILSLSKTISAGMESPLFILCILLFLMYSFTDRYSKSTIFLAGALLTRPDALLVCILAFLFWVYKKGFYKAVQYTLIVVCMVLPWIIFATLYFGSPIPQSLLTKSHVSDIVYQSKTQALKVQLANMSRVYWGKIIDPEHIPAQIVFNLLPFLIFIGLAFLRFWKKYWLFFSIPIIYFISFSFSNPVMYPWYISQIEPFWILFSLAGVFVGYEYLVQKFPKHAKIFFIVCALVLLAGPVYGYVKSVLPQGEGSKMALYKFALYVQEHKKPGDIVGLSNIGIVSYTLMDTYIHDFIGLTRSDTLQYYPIKDECLVKNQYVIPPQMIKDVMPDWIIAGQAEWVPCFVESTWFLSHYKPVYTPDSTGYVWQKIK